MSKFTNVGDIGEKGPIAGLEDNIKSFLDWSFLNIGAYINVDIPTSGIVGSNFHQLHSVSNPGITTNKVWESSRKEWVYESGITFKNGSPNNISGIFLNNTFLPSPTGSGNYGYSINYPLGRITFNNAVASNSTVALNYSYKYVQTYKANESFWWKEIQQQSYNPANFKPSGDSSLSSNHRIQLPAIIIETIPRTVLTPRELGTTQNIILQDILLHIFAENPNQRNIIADIILLQKDNTMYLYDVNKVARSGIGPLNSNGSINNSGLNYDQLSNSQNYRQSWSWIKNSYTSEMNNISNNLFNTVIRWSVEIR